MNIYKTNKINNIYEKIKELTQNDNIFKKETLIIVKNDLLKEEIKKTIAKLNEISYNLNIKKNAIKSIYEICLKNPNIKKYIEKNTFLFYLETEKFILYNILKTENLKYIKDLTSIKNRYFFASKIIDLFHNYYSKFSKLIETWEDNGFLFQEENLKPYENMQKELFKKLFEKHKNILNLHKKIIQEKSTKNVKIEIKKIIFIGNNREIEKKILNSLEKIFDLEVHVLIFEDLLNYKSPFVKELLLTTEKINPIKYQASEKVDIELFKGKNFLTSIKNNIVAQTPLSKLDDSFKIIEAKNQQREVEILVNQIVHSMEKNNLKLSEIAITSLQEKFNEYLPYIEECLNKYEIEYSVLCYNNLSKGESILTLKRLMDLFISKNGTISNFSRKEVFNLLSSNKVMKKFNISISELNYLIEFSDAMNINFGINNTHKENLKYDQNFLNSWEDGFNRFLMSEIFDEKYEGEIQKENTRFQDQESIIKLITIVKSLYEDINYFKNKTYKVSEWAEIIEIFIQKYIDLEEFNTTDEYLQNKIQSFKNFPKDLNDNLCKNYLKEINEIKIEFYLFKILLEESLEKEKYGVMYKKNGILIANYKEIEYLQKKEIHFLGFQKFNSKIDYDNMNLLNEYYEHENTEKEAVTTLFNLIFATSEKFYLYYSLQDNINPEINTSKTINKILNHIQKYEKNFQIEKHPNENHDLAYFKDAKENYLINYDLEAFNIAKILQNSKPTKFKQNKIQLESPIKLNLYELKNALSNPYKHFYEKTLNVKIQDIRLENEIKEKQEEQVFSDIEIIYSLIKNSTLLHEYIMGKKDDGDKVIEIIKNHIKHEIQQGNIPFNIDQKTNMNDIFKKINKLQYNAAINFKKLLIMEKTKIKFCQTIKINFQKKNIKFELKKDIENVYKIENDYFYLNFVKKDYCNISDKIKNEIDLYITGLLLKKEIQNFNSLTEIKIDLDNLSVKATICYHHNEIIINDIENMLMQFAYISSYPTPIYQSLIIKILTKTNQDNFSNCFKNFIKMQIKNPSKAYFTSKAHERFLKKSEITLCDYYNRFKDTHDFKLDKNLLTLMEKFYIKFARTKN
ncbi:exodeoxyribonuclease V subunit gamma [Borreliella yangtzensis]|uniref:Exodeoxyribonuclease V gamma subunit n=1 Tax=Borreliella yangtzensis TaxID=683292 RepID=A0ABR6P8N8_9SPIR|nr:exodeoxyribonuclease V subunit gamma [Borreliella yangtzensis]MBB6042619.1 exodeoxyribonuclease V gamma subunit [Borreliella yangtzensis]WKC73583.1 exodeoxyribonuclease V subunit gamma [Borreliella yangtzensis]WKC74499.1 exodeoxyribonuclease V subunit gamma [Borreliella yangtzensis]